MKGFEKAAVVFIDILGTRDRHEFNEWYKIASIFHDMIEREKKLDQTHEYTAYKREIHMFSDCAFIIYDYRENVEEERKNTNALMNIACYNTEKVLFEFLKNGFIARGALTYGDVYYEVNKNMYFGPAMNRAYDLETHIAKYPRVIIDPEWADELMKYNKDVYQDTEMNRKINGEIIKKDNDGICYMHYLNTMQLGGHQIEEEQIVEDILRLCDRERNKERETQKIKESIQAKYDWLESYLKSSRYCGDRICDIDITDSQMMKQLAEEEMQMLKNLNIY